MLKKIAIYIIVITVIFCGGFFSGRISTEGRTTELERQTADLTEQLKTEADRNRERTELISEAAGRITELQNEIDSLTKSNRYLTDKLAGIGDSINTDIQTVSEVRERMEFYLKKAKVLENNVND